MNTEHALPDGLLLTYYGDDFTGSTDAMEAMTLSGLSTVLFLTAPDAGAMQRFPDVRCVGLAGASRGQTSEWMEQELSSAFASLKALGAPILHYKVCSTFDSSPTTGSIGKAIELGTAMMPAHWSPTVVGAPRLKRYQVFGHLFAIADGVGYRLDRHPTMSRHPVTPMHESDLCRHLGLQTTRRIALIDMVQMKSGQADQRVSVLQGTDVPVVMIDVLDDATLIEAGRLVWTQRGPGLFSASSSGLQYALTAYWREQNMLAATVDIPVVQPAGAIAVVSGSCSPVTASQIRWARSNGFLTSRLDIKKCLQVHTRDIEIARVVRASTEAILDGQSALVYSAEGPEDLAVLGFDAIAAEAGHTCREAARQIGSSLAQVMQHILDQVDTRRIVVAGGDSSGEVASLLEIQALTVIASVTPGAPLCRAWSDNIRRDGLELILKGGQMGEENFFGLVRDGIPIRT